MPRRCDDKPVVSLNSVHLTASCSLVSWRRLAVPTAFVVIIVSFAVNSIITRYLVSGNLVGPLPLTIIRFLSGLATLHLMTTGLSGRFKRTRAGRRDLVGALFLGLYAFAISFGYFFIPAVAGALYMVMVSTAISYVVWNSVLKRVRASQGGLAQLLVPVLTAAMGVVLLAEKISAALVVGGALILAGIYVNGSRVVERRTLQTSRSRDQKEERPSPTQEPGRVHGNI